MNSEVGGIAGGLFRLFNAVGRAFFSVLIGSLRAGRDDLQGERVVIGSMVASALLGALLALGGPTVGAFSRYNTSAITICFALLGLLLGVLVLHYARAVDAAVAKEAVERARIERFENLKQEKRAEYIAQGISVEEAEKKAVAAARAVVYGTDGCFIASVCFGPEAPQVVLLRTWRESRLRPHWYGRIGIRVYYRVGPLFAYVASKWPLGRSAATRLLVFWCQTLKDSGYPGSHSALLLALHGYPRDLDAATTTKS